MYHNTRVDRMNVTLVSKLWREASLPPLWESVVVKARRERGSGQKLVLLRMALEASKSNQAANNGYGRFVKRLAIDMDYCSRGELFKILALCPNLQILTVDKNNAWKNFKRPKDSLPSSLTRFEWFQTEIHVDSTATFLNQFPLVTSLFLRGSLVVRKQVTLAHIVSLDIRLETSPDALVDKILLPALTRLTLSCGAIDVPPALITALGPNLNYLSIESYIPDRVVKTAAEFLSCAHDLQYLVLQIPSAWGDGTVTLSHLPAHTAIREIGIRVDNPTSVTRLLKEILSRQDIPSLECVRFVAGEDCWIDPRRETVLNEDLRSLLLVARDHRGITVEDWRGLSLLCACWDIDRVEKPNNNMERFPVDATILPS